MAKDNTVIHFDVHEEKMKNKNYDLLALAAVNLDCKVINNEKRISEVEFRKKLRHLLQLSNYKIKILIQTFVDLGVIKQEGKDIILLPVGAGKPFIRLNLYTIRYCLDSLSPLAFKVYCFLKRKYDLHILYDYKENYCFSDKELLESCGLSRKYENCLTLSNILNTLEELNLIKYNHKAHGKAGSHGLYKDLYWVKEASNVVAKSLNEANNDIKLLNSQLQEQPVLQESKETKAIQDKKYLDKQDILEIVGLKFENGYVESKRFPIYEDWKIKRKGNIEDYYTEVKDFFSQRMHEGHLV